MTNEELKQIILSDIQYIKDKSDQLNEKLINFNLSNENLNVIKSVLTFFQDFNATPIKNNKQITNLISINKYINSLSLSIKAFLDNTKENERLISLIQEMDYFYNHIAKFKDATSRLTRIGKILSDMNKMDNTDLSIEEKIKKLEKSFVKIESSDSQIEIAKILTQAKQLFEKASTSEKILDEKIQTLINTSEKQVAYTLSEQFEKKTDSLKRPIWSYLILIILLPIYISYESIGFIELFLKPASNEIYWHTIFMLLLTKLPIIFLILFVLNEYTKAKKLFEEYEHKRIMAATLVNNLERLKNELHADEKDLLELIKVPFEKIFDNPVHSIYGDKSGDKNIGLDQLEKIASILTKLKPNNQ